MSQRLVKKWLIAQIKPNSYDLAIRNLERQGFEVFLPKMEITTKKENRFIYKNVFVFPGYMFIGFDPQKFNWTKINSTYGVSKVLVFNKKPSEISYDLIVGLKQRYQVNGDPIPKEILQKGDVIKFNSGPFVDLIARIENVDETNRIWVLLEAMGGYRRLKLQQTGKLKYNKV
tara:strand:- start:665 stop:1183 length:519 start_codon:yes stop_codon:yes gene_type:complete